MTSNNRIGSLTTSIGNTIAFNGENGVLVSSGTGNAIVNNRIFSNGLLGIDLFPTGVTPNDATDADGGSNNLLNFPVLSSAQDGRQRSKGPGRLSTRHRADRSTCTSTRARPATRRAPAKARRRSAS